MATNLYKYYRYTQLILKSFCKKLVGNRFRGVNQRGEEVLTFLSVVLVARRAAKA